MTRTFFVRSVPGKMILAAILCGLGTASALAQSASSTTQVAPGATATGPAKPIGPAPANSPQQQTLNGALSPQTRQTLQQAMNSYPAETHPAPAAK